MGAIRTPSARAGPCMATRVEFNMANSHPPPLKKDSATDTGLRCEHCDYNLTGLSENRCPECGNTFLQDGFTTPSRTAQKYAAIGHSLACLFIMAITVYCVPYSIENKGSIFVLAPSGAVAVLATAIVFQLPTLLLCTIAGICQHEENRYRRTISFFSRAAALATVINIAVAVFVLSMAWSR